MTQVLGVRGCINGDQMVNNQGGALVRGARSARVIRGGEGTIAFCRGSVDQNRCISKGSIEFNQKFGARQHLGSKQIRQFRELCSCGPKASSETYHFQKGNVV